MAGLRIAFLGQNSDITLEHLRAVEARFGLVALIESAPRGFDSEKRGRGIDAARKRRSKLWRIARRQKLPFFFLTSDAHGELADFITEQRIDLVCIASMSQLVKEPALSRAPHGMIAFHPSLLPKYRGPNPWFWQYYFVEEYIGVSIILLDEGEDTGDVLQQTPISVEVGTPFEIVKERSLAVGCRLMVKAIEALGNGELIRRQQSQLSCPFRARGVQRHEKLIDWQAWSIERVWHVLRGTGAWLSAIPIPPGRTRGKWIVGEITHCEPVGLPGELREDVRGFFVDHHSGQIRLTWCENAHGAGGRVAQVTDRG